MWAAEGSHSRRRSALAIWDGPTLLKLCTSRFKSAYWYQIVQLRLGWKVLINSLGIR